MIAAKALEKDRTRRGTLPPRSWLPTYASWAGTLLGLDARVVLVAENSDRATELRRLRLARVGLERVAGYLDGRIQGWVDAHLPLEQIPQIEVGQLQHFIQPGAREPPGGGRMPSRRVAGRSRGRCRAQAA